MQRLWGASILEMSEEEQRCQGRAGRGKDGGHAVRAVEGGRWGQNLQGRGGQGRDLAFILSQGSTQRALMRPARWSKWIRKN